jgi:hypothetical protein
MVISVVAKKYSVMKSILPFLIMSILISNTGMGQPNLSCEFTVASKVCKNQPVAITYTGGASSNATYTWNFDGAVVLSGSGQGPFSVKWETIGEKHVTLSITLEAQNCTVTRAVVVVEAPTQFQMTGGGFVTPGGPGVEVGLSNSEAGVIYKLRRDGVYTNIAILGTGPISFGLQTVTGTYTAVGKLSGSDCMTEMAGAAIVTNQTDPPVLCMITFDTVVLKNKIIWNSVQNSGFTKVNIYKETYQNNHFEKIGEASATGPNHYIDGLANPLIKSDKYKISFGDALGYETEKSQAHKTIHLNVNPGVSGFNLIWNHYEGFEFLTYRIHRKHEAGPWMTIDSVAGNVDSYTDLYSGSGLMTYYIEVVRPEPCQLTLRTNEPPTVISNIASARPLGIASNSIPGVSVFPNPVKDFLTVLTQDGRNLSAQIQTIEGRCIYSGEISGTRGVIPTAQWARGIYILKITGPEGTMIRKIIKD